MNFGSKRQDRKWLASYQVLKTLGDVQGHCNLSSRCIVTLPDGHTDINLGYWLRQQRRLKAKHKLHPDRELLLQNLVDEGRLQWDAPHDIISKDEKNWNEMWCMLLRGETIENRNTKRKIKRWLSYQRALKSNGKLNPEREAKLNELAEKGKIKWRVERGHTDNDAWNFRYELLLQYGALHGNDCNVPSDAVVNVQTNSSSIIKTVRLGRWLAKQRQLRRTKDLREDRRQRLQLLVDNGQLLWHAGRRSACVDGSSTNNKNQKRKRKNSDSEEEEDEEDSASVTSDGSTSSTVSSSVENENE